MNKFLVSLRRVALKTLVPEFIWPREIDIDGVKVQLRNAPYSFGIKSLLYTKPEMYECDERELCKRALHPGDQVLEFGGSIGILSAIISKRIGPKGMLLSVEADKHLVEYVNRSTHGNGKFRMISGIAFPIYRTLNLDVDFDSTMGGSLGGRVSYQTSERKSAHDIHFIGSIESQFHFKPNILVIDIEGSEDIMCQYKPEFPEWIRKIIIELHPGIYGNETLLSIIEVIKAEGFSLEVKLGQVYLFER